jgi:acetyl-CoA carboxylase carboxyl transferase subunit beta
MLGDVQLAEPTALICFAGPRVIQQTIREQLPEGFQRAEYLLAHGMIDMVVHRHKLRETLARLVRLLGQQTGLGKARLNGSTPNGVYVNGHDTSGKTGVAEPVADVDRVDPAKLAAKGPTKPADSDKAKPKALPGNNG